MISLEEAKKENIRELSQNKNIMEVYLIQLRECLDNYYPDYAVETEERYAENFLTEIKVLVSSLENVVESTKAEYRVKKVLEDIS